MPRTRTWNDGDLVAAIQASRSWRGVQRELGLQTTSVTRGLRRRADELGVDYRHFTAQRTWGDEDLRAAVAKCVTWVDVADVLGLARQSGSAMAALKQHADRLGLDTSHFGYARSGRPATVSGPLPFQRKAAVSGATTGLSTAARWFLDRGYLVSVPLEPAPYDLVAESDEGLKKIQVKTTRRRGRNGRYQVGLTRNIYDPALVPNAAGKNRRTPYQPGTVDYFFIVANGDAMYLIPFETVAGRTAIVLDAKYASFKV
jgi:hypothetical protein